MAEPVLPALLQHHPGLVGRIPWLSLGAYPTRVHRLPGVERALAGRAEIWIKRDDESAELYGGNKVRKLEWVLAAHGAAERRDVCTLGAWGSHQVLATALYARSLGLGCSAVVFPQPATPHVAEVLARSVAAGCRLYPVPSLLAVPLGMAQLRATALLGGGRWPALIAPGTSTPLGALGYVSAALELADQIRSGYIPVPDAIVVALGSAGTAAGLVVGLRLAGLAIPVHAVRVVSPVLAPASRLAALVHATGRLLTRHGVDLQIPFTGWRIDGQRLGPGYGYASAEAMAAIDLAAADGVTLDPTYTAKAFAGLVEGARGAAPGCRWLYWHTLDSRPATALAPAGWFPEVLRRQLDASK